MSEMRTEKRSDKLLFERDARGVATLSFNRPEASNAYDQDMLDLLAGHFTRLGEDNTIRAIVLRGAGRHFSGGADVRWRSSRADPRSGPAPGDAPPLSVFELCEHISACPRPTVALVQGGCIGGAFAIASSCDILIAARNASFAVPEVRLGFAPGTRAAPLFARAMGVRNFRRYGMTGQRFGAEEALRIGLAHEVCEPELLQQALARQLDELLAAAPGAARQAKKIADRLAPPRPSLEDMEPLFAADNPEAAEGHRSFLEKRRPNWYPN